MVEQDRAGELGIFSNSIADGWFHVGIPIAQTLLTERERAVLHTVYLHEQPWTPMLPPLTKSLLRW